MNRNLFRITRFILIKAPLIFGFLARFRKPSKRVLIIKTDAIGDYILFRNFIQIITGSPEFGGHSFTLLGNELWKDLVLEYDSEFISDFLFTDTGKLYHSPMETLKLGWQLFKNNYKTVLQPSSTRLFVTDGLAALAAAKQLIGFTGDNEGIVIKYKIKTDRFYTVLFMLPNDVNFEFYREKFFFESVLKREISLQSAAISIDEKENRGIVIFVGSGDLKRSWEKEKFLQLIKLILNYTSKHKIYLAGGSDAIETGYYLTQNLPENSLNDLIGKTSLIQLVQLIGNAALVISNETSATHIAAATQTNSISILGGGHFGRFAPYPIEMPYPPVCVYEKMECYNCNWTCKFQTGFSNPYPCIANIGVEKVWLATLQMLTAL